MNHKIIVQLLQLMRRLNPGWIHYWDDGQIVSKRTP